MTGVISTKEFNDQVVRVVRQVLREERGGTRDRSRHNTDPMPWYWAISNEAIPAASNGLTTPGSGTVELLKTTYTTGSPNLERGGETETATNRSEHVAITEDTLLMCARYRGELVIMWADCNSLTSPPA